MQQVLPKWMWTIGLILFAAMVMSVTDLLPRLAIDVPRLRLASSLSSAAVVILVLFFSGRSQWAPWRLIWCAIPKLNEWIFPDLNGVWVGTAHSNWAAIERLRTAATSGEKLNLDELFDLERIASPIVIQIRSNIFGIQIVSYQANTVSKSRSLSSGIERDAKSEAFLLNYTYRQENAVVSATDSETHVGAAMLEIEYADLNRASGSYWTKRCWEDGRNTAGKISVARASRESNLSTSQLQSYL